MSKREPGISGGTYWLLVALGASVTAYAVRWVLVRSHAKLLITEVEKHLEGSCGNS